MGSSKRQRKRKERMDRKARKKKVNQKVGKSHVRNVKGEHKNIVELAGHRKKLLGGYRQLLMRTKVTESDNVNEAIVQKLQKFGIKRENIVFLDVSVDKEGLDEKDKVATRGGFTKKEHEHKVCNATIGYGLLSYVRKSLIDGRDSFRMKYAKDKNGEPLALVFRDAMGDTSVIHLVDVLKDEEVEARESVAREVRDAKNNRWCKHCQFSGNPNHKAIEQKLLNNEATRDAYFGGNSKNSVQIDKVNVTRDGAGKSASLDYVNSEGEEMNFQLGNEITRGIYHVGNELGNGEDNAYLKKAMSVLQVLGSFIHLPQVTGRRRNLLNLRLFDMHLAYNEMCHGDTFHALHLDGHSRIPTVLSACPGDVPLMSGEKHMADAGLLLHEIGGIVHGYGRRDLLIFSGNNLHCPFPPTPWNLRKNVGSNTRGQAKRESFVLFYK